MALDAQQVSVPLGMGLDEKTGSPTAQRLLACSNVRARKVGSVECRPGYAALTTTTDDGTLSSGRRLFAAGAELCCIDGNRTVYSYAPTVTPRWRSVARVPEAMLCQRIAGTKSPACLGYPADAVHCNGLYITAHMEPRDASTSFLRLTTIDSATGARKAASPVVVGLTARFRLVAKGTKCYLFFALSGHVYGKILDCSTSYGTWGASVDLAAVDYPDRFEVCLTVGGTLLLAVDTVATSGGGGVHLRKLSDALAVLTNVAGTAPSAGHLTVCGDDSEAWFVSYGRAGTGLVADKFDPDTGAHLLYGVIDTDAAGAVRLGSCTIGSSFAVTYTIGHTGSGTEKPYLLRCAMSDYTITLEATCQTYHLIGLSTPVYDVALGVTMLACIPRWDWTSVPGVGAPDTKYVNAAKTVGSAGGASGAPQSGVFLVRMSMQDTTTWTDAPHAKAMARASWQTFAESYYQYAPVSLAPVSASRYVAAITQQSGEIDATLDNARVPGGHDLFLFDLDPLTSWLPAGANRMTCLSGGVPAVYDSCGVEAYGYGWYPSLVLADSDGTGSLSVGVTYGYAVTYEAINGAGVVQRSAPSFYTHVCAIGTKKVVFEVPTLTVIHSDVPAGTVKVCLWRSVSTVPGIYHLLATADNDTRLSCVQFTDDGAAGDSADAVLQEKRILYTDGGVLENIAPPAFRHIVYHANRFCGISADDTELVWLSKIHSHNELPGFNEALTLRVATADLTALASLDGKLVAFSNDSIWVVFGAGPSDTLQGNDLTDPQQVSPNVGCIDARSVVQTPAGVFFQGRDGIYLLDRGMAVKPVGLPVEDTIATYSTVTGAACVEADGEVRFTVRHPVLNAGRVLVYNYLLDQWHTWAVDNAAGQHNTAFASSCAALVSGVPTHHMVSAAGVVNRESGYTDPDGGYPDCSITTPWIHLAGVQGFQRVRRVGVLGEMLSTGAVTLTGYVDYKQASAWSKAWTSAEVTAFATGTRAQPQVHVPAQKCAAIQVRIDMTPGASGGGIRLHDLCLEIGAKRGQGKHLAAAERK